MKNKRRLKAYEKDNRVVIELDYTYLYSLKYAIRKAFNYGYASHYDYDEYIDLIEIENELNNIKGSMNE